MPISLYDIVLSLFVYAFLIAVMKWRFSMFKKKDHEQDDDGDGGILVEYPTDPVLDLPPGVTLPVGDGPAIPIESDLLEAN